MSEMTEWIILASILGLLALLLLSSLSLRISYREGEFIATAHFLFLRFSLYPVKEKKGKEAKVVAPKKERQKNRRRARRKAGVFRAAG